MEMPNALEAAYVNEVAGHVVIPITNVTIYGDTEQTRNLYAHIWKLVCVGKSRESPGFRKTRGVWVICIC